MKLELTKELKTQLININKKYVSKDFDGAYNDYLNMLIDNPGNAYILHNLGVTCHHMKKYTEGAGYFLEALKTDYFDNNHMAFVNATNCCVCAGDMINAKAFIEKAYSIKPDDAKVELLYKKIASCFINKID